LRTWEEKANQVFYRESKIIWRPDLTKARETKKQINESYLVGFHEWHFSLSLPSEVQAAFDAKRTRIETMIEAPPTFSARPSNAFIDYRLVVTFQRGLLRGDQLYGTALRQEC